MGWVRAGWDTWPVYCVRSVRTLRQITVVLWAHRRQLHKIGWQATKFLWTVRRAFPWALRMLIIIGAIQIPVLPTDEIAAAVALVWIAARYRKLARVIWRAALLEVTSRQTATMGVPQ